MTLAWAIIIVTVLLLLHKYHLLKKSLIAAAIIAVVLIVGVVGWIGWHYLDARWEEHENNVRVAQSNAQFAKNNECLEPSTGKVRPVNESGSPWCDTNEAIHERGTPMDPWAIVSETPTVPPGEYYVTNGERDSDGIGSATPAQICVDSNGLQRCYTFPRLCVGSHELQCHSSPSGGRTFGINAEAEEVSYKGGKLILFTAEDESASEVWLALTLLANRGGQLENLLPEIPSSDERHFWNLPDISTMPILVTTYYLWGDEECHACPHRYLVASYVYSKQAGRYIQYDEFMTEDKYASNDKVLEPEKTKILAGLKRAAAEEAARHIIVK
jgi:hypothetical protein